MNIPSFLDRNKKKKIDQMLDGDHILAHINTTIEGVSLPKDLYQHKIITLKLSRLFRGEMNITNSQIEANLLFGNHYFKCIIPFSAIWSVTDESGNTTSWEEKKFENMVKEQLESALELSKPDKTATSKEQKENSEQPNSNETKGRPKLVRIK